MILVIDCGSSKTPKIIELVDEFMDVDSVKILDFDSETIENYKGVIISGAPLLITEMDIQPYLEKLTWIKNTTIPILGICFGHQLIGLTFGAFGSKMKEDRDLQLIEVYEECPLFDKLPTEIYLMEDHCETISIPFGFKLIASSDACVNETMQHNELPIFGLQFHPEVSGNHGRIIIENFVKYCEKPE